MRFFCLRCKFSSTNSSVAESSLNYGRNSLHNSLTRCKECGINHELVILWDGHSFDKDVKTSVIDRGYTDYSEKYALAEAEKFNYEL